MILELWLLYLSLGKVVDPLQKFVFLTMLVHLIIYLY